MGIFGCLRFLCGRSLSPEDRVKMAYPVYDESEPDFDKLNQLINWGKYDSDRLESIRTILRRKVTHHVERSQINKLKVDLKIYDTIMNKKSGHELGFAEDLYQVTEILWNSKREEMEELTISAVSTLINNTSTPVLAKVGQSLINEVLKLPLNLQLQILPIVVSRKGWDFHTRYLLLGHMFPLLLHENQTEQILFIIKQIIKQSFSFELNNLLTSLLTIQIDEVKDVGEILLNSCNGRVQEWILTGYIYLAYFQSHTDNILQILNSYLDIVNWDFEASPLIFCSLARFLILTDRTENQKEICQRISSRMLGFCKSKEELKKSIRMYVGDLGPKTTQNIFSILQIEW